MLLWHVENTSNFELHIQYQSFFQLIKFNPEKREGDHAFGELQQGKGINGMRVGI